METWIFYALWGLITLWGLDFIRKLVASKWIHKELFTLLSSLSTALFFGVYTFVSDPNFFVVSHLIPWIILWTAWFLASFWITVCLRYLDTWFALISLRLISSFLLLFIGIFLLNDYLSIYNFIWFFIWAIAIFLLSDVKKHQKKSTLHWKWVLWLIFAIIWSVVFNSYLKYIVSDIDIIPVFYILFCTSFLLVLCYSLIRQKFKNISKQELYLSLPYIILFTLFFIIQYLYFLPNIYLFWPLSLGYKMLSYSLIVPILLSVIFLWDKVDKKRIIAFALTVISIFLFLI